VTRAEVIEQVRRAGVAAAVALTAGCGATVDGPGAELEPVGPDADEGPGPVPTADAAPTVAADNACGVAATQGDVGSLVAFAAVANQGDTDRLVYSLAAPTPATAGEAAPDVLYLELWDGYGAFRDGSVQPGTYMIAGEETSYATCGVCVFTLADLVSDNGPARILQATAGIAIVHAVGAAPGATVAVEVQDVVFQEVDAQEFQPVGSSCPSPLAHGRLDGVLAP
jgi:hypothetical protein